jgi:hypothetical protein
MQFSGFARALAAGRHRWLAPLLLIAALTGLHALWLHGIPYNSDESQHLHVAWAWTQGLLPYRDVFDNHGPLFGLVNAPLLAWLGQRAAIVYPMRFAMLPWFVLSLASIHLLGRHLYGRTAGLAACGVAALYPTFFVASGQVRTDCMWVALWLASLAIVLIPRAGAWRWFAAGLLAGLSLCVSQKTLLLLACYPGSALLLAVAEPPARSDAVFVRRLLSGFGGLLLPPAFCFAGFVALGITHAALYGLVFHNMIPLHERAAYSGLRHIFFWPLLVLSFALAWRMARVASPFARSRAVLLLGSLAYALTLYAWWPLVTRQDQLPLAAGIAIVACGEVGWLLRATRWRAPVWAAALAVEFVLLLIGSPPWHDALADQRSERALVLQLTTPGDPVMDAKGETVFRRRPFFYALETVTQQRLLGGLTPDTIAADLRKTKTHVVVDRRLPPRDAAFIAANYLPAWENVDVAGKRLPAGGTQAVRIEIPGDYTLLSRHGALRASMDGGTPASTWRLDSGVHAFRMHAAGPALLVWSPALERGLNPAALWAHAHP